LQIWASQHAQLDEDDEGDEAQLLELSDGDGGLRRCLSVRSLYRITREGEKERRRHQNGRREARVFQVIRDAEDKERRGLTHSVWLGKRWRKRSRVPRACLRKTTTKWREVDQLQKNELN
jgi:hypothetical protein